MPQPSWNELFADSRFHWAEPDAGVVEMASRWHASGCQRIYDLGCGAGRHMAYLQAQGFTVVGTDLAENGLAVCAARLLESGLPAPLARADMTRAPFTPSSFDAAISINVLNHNCRSALQQALDELHRVLVPGGECYLTVLTTSDWRYGSGEEVEPDSFVLAEGPETGILHHFFSEQDLREWVKAFRIIELRRERGELRLTTAPEGEPVLRDAWAVLLEKP